MAKNRLRLRTSNHFKVLLCYLFSFALPVLWQLAALWLVYPVKLINTAPAIAETLLHLLPFRPEALADAAQAAAQPGTADPALWQQAAAVRDQHWLVYLAVCFAAAWLITLLVQLIWRIRHSRAINAARLCRRARRSYRLHLLIILWLNILPALLIWLTGVQHIPGRTLWDWLVYFPAYGLNVLAAILCFRLAAPPAISGKHGFFKRL